MRYLFIHEDATLEQVHRDLTHDDLKSVADGILNIVTYGPERGFTKLLVTEDDEGNVEENDWERIVVQT